MNVLTVNLNIMMKDCIRLYEQYVNEEENPSVLWNALEQHLGLEKFLCVDSNIICEIIRTLKPLKNKGVPFYFTENPKNIPEIFKDCKDKISLVNVDYFHHIYYDAFQLLEDFGKYNENNWVGYMLFNGKLESYEWGKVSTSQDFKPQESVSEELFNRCHSIITTPYNEVLKSVENRDFDKVILCYSNSYIPYKFEFIWRMLYAFFGEESMGGV